MARWRNIRRALQESHLPAWRRLAKAALVAIPYNLRRGSSYRGKVRYMLESQWYSLDEIRARQFERVCNIVRYAYSHSAFYARKYREAGFVPADLQTWDDFHRLPFVTKDELRTNAAEVGSNEIKAIRHRTSSTGASTGKGLAFPLDDEVLEWEWAVLARQYSWTGIYRPDDPRVVLRGPLADGMGDAYFCPLWKDLHLNTACLDQNGLRKILDEILKYRPVAINGYPSVLELFCQWLDELGEERLRPKVIFTNSEPLYRYQRVLFERVFRCRVYETYGLSEHCVSAMECEKGVLHVSPEYTYEELVDTDPETGNAELVGTSLYGRAFPFIRYRTDDFARKGGYCECGRALPTIQGVTGRHGDFLVRPDGSRVSPTIVAFCTDKVNAVAIQYVQTEKTCVTMRVVPKPSFGEADAARLQAQARRFLGEGMRVEICLVPELPRSPRGKTRFVICRLEGLSSRQALSGIAPQ